jgi:hypothetical protein
MQSCITLHGTSVQLATADELKNKWNNPEYEILINEFGCGYATENIYSPTNDLIYKRFAHECVRCKILFPMKVCNNCNGVNFTESNIIGHGLGISCTSCNYGHSRIICPDCGTDNPALITLRHIYTKDIKKECIKEIKESLIVCPISGVASLFFSLIIGLFLFNKISYNDWKTLTLVLFIVGFCLPLYRVIEYYNKYKDILSYIRSSKLK